MGVLDSIGGFLGLGRSNSDLAQSFQDPNQQNFNLPGFEDRGNRLLGLAEGAQGRQAPQSQGAQIGEFERSGQSGFRAGQEGLIGQLQQQAAGQGPSLAAQHLRRATDRGIAQQQALAASAGPSNAAAAARQASQQAGALNSALAGQTADARIQEQLAARQQLAGVLGQARGQDIGQSQFNAAQQNQRLLEGARLLQQNNQFNTDASLRQTGLNDQLLQGLLGQELQNAQSQQQGGIGYEGARTARYGTILGTPTAGEQLLTGAAGLLGTI